MEAGKPLSIEQVDVAGPTAGEVLVWIVATDACHADAFTRSGADPGWACFRSSSGIKATLAALAALAGLAGLRAGVVLNDAPTLPASLY